MRCTAFCTAKSYDLNKIRNWCQEEGIAFNWYRDVLHLTVEENRDVFFFHYGAVVFWDLFSEQEQRWLSFVQAFEIERNKLVEQDDFTFSYGSTARIRGEEIILPRDEPLAKLAASHGLAQSVKLTIFEEATFANVEGVLKISQELAQNGRIRSSRKAIAKKMGQLFIERNTINLHFDVLDTPEIFWEYSHLEPYYGAVVNYLDLGNRLTILNKRLDIIKEMFDMLSNELNHQHSAMLEWVIIILILIEVIFTVAHDLFKII